MTKLPIIMGVPKPTKADRPKKPKPSIPRRKVILGQIEAIVRQIVFWRDGMQCVEVEIDGVRCGGSLQWGHFIARQQSGWLKYDLATFCQCRNHNNLHDKGAQTMHVWFVEKFGTGAQAALELAAREHANGKQRPIYELEEMLAHYDALYDAHFSVTAELSELVEKGYYGQIIRDAWIKEGRLPVVEVEAEMD